MARPSILATLALGTAAMDVTEQLAWLMTTVQTQSARLDAQEREIARLSAQLAGGANAGTGRPTPMPAQEGRRLSTDEERGTWFQSVYHTFEEPASGGCGLHAELNHESTGPLMIRRTKDGNLSMEYGATEAFQVPSPLSVRHPPGCGNTTLEINGHVSVPSGSLSLNGAALRVPFIYNPSGTAIFGSTGDNVYPGGNDASADSGFSELVSLKQASKLIVSYQAGLRTSGFAGNWIYVFTYLTLSTAGGVQNQKLPESAGMCGIAGGGNVVMSDNGGMWMGELPEGEHTFKIAYVKGTNQIDIPFEPWTIQVMVL